MQNRLGSFPVILLVVALGLVSFGLYNLNKMPTSPYPEMKPAFHLHTDTGAVDLTDFAGKVAVVYFGYTRCPDVCPATLVNVGRALDLLDEEEKRKTKGIFISLDSERDTPEIAAKYARYFHPSIIGLTGSKEEAAAAAKAFFVGYQKDDTENYGINHSTYLFIIRPDGKLGAMIGHESTPKEIAEAIRHWLPWAEG